MAETIISNLKDYFPKQSKIYSLLGPDNILVWGADIEEFLITHPQLSELKINTHYFGRIVSIEVKERKKYGLWCQDLEETGNGEQLIGNNEFNNSTSSSFISDIEISSVGIFSADNQKCYWFDDTGMAFSESPVIESELFKKVSDFSGQEIKLGEKVMPEKFFENLKKIFKIIDVSVINSNTIKIKDMSLQEVEVDSLADPKLLFSLNNNPEFSLSAIDSLKKSGKWEKLNYIDFRVENRAYYK
ncbi:hypothetical protein COV23_01340 [Candidatus Wolfebacteria bacterium CG10_big_fil_rev_8_21_14_0_10_31_9]|uniref:POTRA domain-containing protein n=1 Tax=Candidatus Wolfebacteria bacterium CG10_big_fil_rev_8_21_14_0_10_31_9 TaxID=1975070 RepID=A0A2H0RCC1_9BACT|nr:MAG: hypothetical protein COV23_01340 [Candidatus Wolfebacteria bacterium CG10_big_fil_rev_8_21_14_0_10_31_9]